MDDKLVDAIRLYESKTGHSAPTLYLDSLSLDKALELLRNATLSGEALTEPLAADSDERPVTIA